jgi:hypothetical protein
MRLPKGKNIKFNYASKIFSFFMTEKIFILKACKTKTTSKG